MRICTRCIMDETDPDIEFDENGVCSNCRRFEIALKARLGLPEHRESNLHKIIDNIKQSGTDKDYDCIIGVSGGTDSTYLCLMAKRFGLRPLAVHLDNGWDSERAVSNIEKVLDKLGIELFTYVIDWEEFKDLQLSFLKASTPDAEIPTDHAIISVLYRIAAEKGIKYILDGTNYAAEGLIPETSWSYGHLDWRYISHIHAKHGKTPLKTYPRLSTSDLINYILIKRISYVSLINYLPFSKAKAIETLKNDLGWEYYGGKHYESVYTRFFQAYILPKKFNIDKRKAHLSSLIISTKEISREQALEEISKPPMPDDLLRTDYIYVLKKLGLSEPEFEQIMQLPVRSFRDYKNSHYFFQFKKHFLRIARNIGISYR